MTGKGWGVLGYVVETSFAYFVFISPPWIIFYGHGLFLITKSY